MRKNKMLRMASALLMLVLLTTSVVGGTFAKYVTEADASDSARVAKWGIKMDVDGSGTFKAAYDTTVQSENSTDKVVAPGTSGTAIYSVSGAPETAYKITFTGTKTNDVFLAKGLKFKYTDSDTNGGAVNYIKPGTSTESMVSENYYPIKYTVTVISANATFSGSGGITNDTSKEFDTLEAAMTALSNTTLTYDANEAANLEVKIGWKWAFDSTTEPTSNDVNDTILGDIIAGNADLTVDGKTGTAIQPNVDGKYGTSIEFDLTITATQID